MAIEPSSGMRAHAQAHERVRFVSARAEALPLASRSVDRVWLSAVVHHFVGLGAAIAEVRRLLSPRGRVLVRGFFADVELPDWFTSFPGIDRSAAAFPATRHVEAALVRAGLRVLSITDVVERHSVPNPWRLRLRQLHSADSLLRPLSDAEFDAGMAELASRIPDDEAVVEHRATLRLLVADVP